MDLPDLPPSNKDDFWLDVLRKRKIQGLLGDGNYEVGLKGVNLAYPVGDGRIKGSLDYKGNYGVSAQHPLWGGLLSLGVNGGPDEDTMYKLKYKLNF